MSRERPRTLRRILGTIVAFTAALIIALAGALMVLTTLQNRVALLVSDAVESVVLAEEAEIDLLLLERSVDPLVRRERLATLLTKLQAAEAFVSSPDERELLERAKDASRRLGHAQGNDRAAVVDEAFRALQRLVEVNVAQARLARTSVTRLDRIADLLGIVSVLALVGGMAALLTWLRAAAFRPMLALSETIDRFHRGDRNVRAPEAGPAEVREMSSRFNQMAEDLVRQRDAQVAFLGGVAHDLRNPLNALKLALSRALPSSGPLPAEEILRTALTRASRQVGRLERMVTDVLEAAQIEAGRLDVQRRPLDLRQVVDEVVAGFEGTSGKGRVVVKVPDRPVPVSADALRLEQVLSNLVSNALKYSEDGTPVTVAVEAHTDRVLLTVSDHGVGISAADQARLFEPFRRVGLSKDEIPGVGLGLFVVKRLVEAHDGTISVTSEEGKGSTFTVSLPCAPLPAA